MNTSAKRTTPTNNSKSLYLNCPIVQLDGANISQNLVKDLIEIVVEESLHKPSMFTIKIHNVYGKASKDTKTWELENYFKIGGRVSIGFAAGNTQDPNFSESEIKEQLIDGKITGLEVEFNDKSEAHLVIRGDDVSHQLYRGRSSRSFTNRTDTDIVKEVAQQAGVRIGQLDASGKVYKHVYQANQTNIDFLRERAAKVGFELFVRNNKIYFRKPQSESSLELRWRTEITNIDVKVTSAEQVSSVQVNSWDYKRKKLISETASKEQLVTNTGHGKGSKASSKLKMKQSPQMIVVHQPVDSAEEARQMAQAFCNELGGEYLNADAKAVGNPEIRPGKVVNLKDLGTRCSGKYYITGTCHHFIGGNYTTDFTVRGLRESRLLSTVSPKTHLQPGQTLVVGTVTNNKDPENLGRVKVMLDTLTTKHETDWARVLGSGAGKERGFYCLPEIHDEVFVGFEHGDIRRPYILGGLWNGKDKTVETIDNTVKNGAVRLRTIKTRTGHEIQFVEEDDKKSKAGIYIKTSKGHRIDINDSEEFIEIETKGKHSIRMDDKSKKIEIKTEKGQSLTFKDLGMMNVTLETSGKVNINGSKAVNINSKFAGPVNISSDLGGINLVSKSTITMAAPVINLAAPLIQTTALPVPNPIATNAAGMIARTSIATNKLV